MDDLGVSLNWVYKKEYVRKIDQFSHTFKEGEWSAWSVMPFKIFSKLMIVILVASYIFPGKIFLWTVVDYNRVWCLQQGKYVQVDPEDELRNTIDIDQTFRENGYFLNILLTETFLRWPHWTTINMTEDTIEGCDTFNTKWCPDELIFGDFNDKLIPSHYYNFLNYDEEDGNNIPSATVDDALPDDKGVEYIVLTDYEDINDEIIIHDDDSLASEIEPLQN